MIELRRATLEDLDALMEIENECFVSPWKKSDMEYELKDNPVNTFYVVLDDKKVVGFLNYMITFNSSTITQIAVTKEYRRQGLALKLMSKMFEDFLKAEDVIEFSTLEVRSSNIPAINMYKKCGYEEVTIKKHYYADGEDATYMVKRI